MLKSETGIKGAGTGLPHRMPGYITMLFHGFVNALASWQRRAERATNQISTENCCCYTETFCYVETGRSDHVERGDPSRLNGAHSAPLSQTAGIMIV